MSWVDTREIVQQLKNLWAYLDAIRIKNKTRRKTVGMRGNNMKYELSIMGFRDALEYGYSNFSEPYAIISIRDTFGGGNALTFNASGMCKAALNIVIDDIESKSVHKGKELRLMEPEDAEKIVEFIKAVEKLDIERLIVHCHAGVSRSAAVAASIMRYHTGDDSEIFNSDRYAPNRYIYREMLDAFGIGNARTEEEYAEVFKEEG